MKKLIFIAICLLAFPTHAHAFLGGFFDAAIQLVGNIAIVGVSIVIGIVAGPVAGVLFFASQTYQQYKSNELQKQVEEQRRAAIESYNASLKDRTITNVSTESPHVYIYGSARVGSAVQAIFSSGDRDQYQHLICVHAAHEIESIDEIWIASKPLGVLDANGFPTSGYYNDNGAPKVRVKKHLGGASDPADSTLMSEVPGKWFSTSRLQGYAYTYIRLDLNMSDFQGGLPSIEVLIKGKKVYDPRTTLTQWSENPALCLNDYLLSPFCNVPSSDIPIAEVISAANVCDELITVGTLINAKRYTMNGTVSSDQEQERVIRQMVQAMNGGINATTWEMWAGQYVAPTLTLDQADIVGSITINPGISDAEIYNGVTGRFIGTENSYVPTDIKPYQNVAYRNADGRDLMVSLEFPFTDNTQRIYNLARVYIEDQRNSFTVKGTFSLKAWDTKIGQRVSLNSQLFGFTGKVFRIVAKSYSSNGAVDLTLKEDAAEIWDLADAVLVDATSNTDLPNPYFLPSPGNPLVTEVLYETTGSSGVKARANISCPESTSIRTTGYVFEYKLVSSSVWIALPSVTNPATFIDDLAPGVYNFRVKCENAYFSTQSTYSGEATKEILGLTAPPSNVSNFSVIALAGRGLASWNLTVDLDVQIGGRIVIRHSPLTVGAAWENGIILEEFNGDAVNGNLPLLTGTYLAKFKDSSGNYSPLAVSFVATESLISGYTTTSTLTEHTVFVGSKTNLVATDNVLKLIGSATIDSMTESIDLWSEIDTLGGLVSSGTYEFSTYIDFASVVQRKVDANIKAFSYDTANHVDYWVDIDSLDSIDGGVINSTDATLYYRATNDDPAGAPTWGAWTQFIVADTSCRALQFKLDLTTTNPTHQIEIQELSIRARSSP